MSNKPETDAALEQRSRELFNQRVESLDGRTRSRLNQARQKALDEVRTESSGLGLRWLAPTGSMAALALVAMISWQVLRPVNDPESLASDVTIASAAAGEVADLEIITADADLELLQNMDFYTWVEAESVGEVNDESVNGEAS